MLTYDNIQDAMRASCERARTTAIADLEAELSELHDNTGIVPESRLDDAARERTSVLKVASEAVAGAVVEAVNRFAGIGLDGKWLIGYAGQHVNIIATQLDRMFAEHLGGGVHPGSGAVLLPSNDGDKLRKHNAIRESYNTLERNLGSAANAKVQEALAITVIAHPTPEAIAWAKSVLGHEPITSGAVQRDQFQKLLSVIDAEHAGISAPTYMALSDSVRTLFERAQALSEIEKGKPWASMKIDELYRVWRALADSKAGAVSAAEAASDRLYVENFDNFTRVRGINPDLVTPYLRNGRLEISEDDVQKALEEILSVPDHKLDWSGEANDLYTANVIVNGERRPTAFMLKGKGKRTKTLLIKDCGKNGNQLLRLVEAPAEVFVVQFVGNISEDVVKDIRDKIRALRSRGKNAWFCIMDGQDTARVLFAYGKLQVPPTSSQGASHR